MHKKFLFGATFIAALSGIDFNENIREILVFHDIFVF